jgi:hypothetical protein
MMVMLWSGSMTTKAHLYVVVNFRGVVPVYVPSVWKIKMPPKVHVFLWLLSNNKLMTVDNLGRRGVSKPPECLLLPRA